jgi:hypothetical protein
MAAARLAALGAQALRALVSGLSAGFILLLVAYSAAVPVMHGEGRSRSGDVFLLGGLLDLPRSGTLIVEGATRGYSPEEIAAVRAFVERGGRLVVAGVTPASASFVRDLALGVEATPFLVFDPDVDGQGRFQLQATGSLGFTGAQLATQANVILGAGDAVLVTGPFVWQDRDGDGRPGLSEPRGSWSVARIVPAGVGSVLVLGNAGFLDAEPTRSALRAWMAERGPLIVDRGHQNQADPLDAAPLLAGHRPEAILVSLALLVMLTGVVAWRVQARRTATRARRRTVAPETLEMLAELRE